MDPVVDVSRETIRRGSKSFAGASRLIAPATRESVYLLYAWCRYCDDVIDSQDLGRDAPADATGSGSIRLAELRRETHRALSGEPVEHPAFVALQRVVARHRIPHEHPLDLLAGFAMDVEGRQYRTLEETTRYCYHVAGVVGVMMALVMGAREAEALHRAADLGIALQMTNIARDVMDDASAGRIYLPLDSLEQAGVPDTEVDRPYHRKAVHGVVRKLLEQADLYYRSSSSGLRSLGFRSAWAVAAARGVYRDIGQAVLTRGAAAWDRRAFVGRARKLYRVGLAGFEALGAVSLGRFVEPSSREGLWTQPRDPAGR